MNIFLSGGAGFIGSHLACDMIERPDVDAITIYDNFSSGKKSHLMSIQGHKKLTIVNADIKHFDVLTHAMAGADVVFHFAANPDIAKAVSQPDIDFWEGTFLTQNILEAMRMNAVGSIFYMSGSGVYGEIPGEKFKESFGPCLPISTYGASKLACEVLISSYCHMFSIRARVFRCANVVGPRQTHGVGYDFIHRLAVDSSVLQILGDGAQSKSYIDVDDVMRAIQLVEADMRESTTVFDVFNVATDDYITVTDIADLACKTMGLHPSDVRYQYTGGERGWKGDVPFVLLDVTKIKSLGWFAQRNSREAIKHSLDALRAYCAVIKEEKLSIEWE